MPISLYGRSASWSLAGMATPDKPPYPRAVSFMTGTN